MLFKNHTLEFAQLATSALRDLYMNWPEREIDVGADGKGLETLLRSMVSYLRATGSNDEGGWDCAVTNDIPVNTSVAPPSSELRTALEVSATALRDLYMGYRHGDIVCLEGLNGLDNLLIQMVTLLRGLGFDDDKAWNTPITENIPIVPQARPYLSPRAPGYPPAP